MNTHAAQASLRGVRIYRIGHHDAGYSRNRIVAKALARAGAQIVERVLLGPWWRRSPSIFREAISAARAGDLVIVGFPAHTSVPFVRAGALRTPLLFDPLISLWEMSVEDRGITSPRSLRARLCALEDAVACRLSNAVLLDTDAHILWLSRRYGLPKSLFRRLYVGADDDIFYPRPQSPRSRHLRLLFYGSFLPLHGTEFILQAAHELQRRRLPFELLMVGDGQERAAARRLSEELDLRAVHFLDPVSHERLAELISQADVSLGIFGVTPKAHRVIPNKVFDALAMRKSLITADTPAAREAFVDHEHCLLVPPGHPTALADAIEELSDDAVLGEKLAEAGYTLFLDRFSIAAISRTLSGIVSGLLEG